MEKSEITPQEIEVWYVLPAIRKELARSLIQDQGLKQKQAAKLLGITEAAVSQYLNSKRARKACFNKDIIKQIKKSAARVAKDKKWLIDEVQRIFNLLSVRKVVCKIHKEHCSGLTKNCRICFR